MSTMAKSIAAGLLASMPSAVFAQEITINGANTAWILTATALVLFMTIPGLSLFYAGLVRTKNALSVMMQCFAITCLMSLLWFVYGYSLAFGEGNAYIGDLSKVFLAGIGRDSLSGDIPETVFMTFQMTFAIITPALVVGGFAERMKFSAMLLFSAIWFTLVYVPVTHWVWGGGWLGAMGLYDFAGGTVVHITAGVSAVTAAVVIGARKGFPEVSMPPHNLAISVAGAGMLWVGWYGFNAGSALAADGNAGMALLVTHVSAAAGSLAWMAAEWNKYGKPSVLGIITGMVAGLGAITPASGYVGPGGALVIGIAAGLTCFAATNYLKRVLRIDDSLDVFPVHGVGGILGTLSAGVFASTGLGIFSGFGFAEGIDSMADQVGVQFIGVASTVLYAAIASFIILKILDLIIGLRVTPDEETEGLDIVLHEERGYNL